MVELQTIFNEEPDAVASIMGLRMASSEFRSAFFRVREVLIECKVSSNVDNRRPSEKKEEKSEGIIECHSDGTRVEIPEKKEIFPEAPKIKKKSEPVTKKSTTEKKIDAIEKTGSPLDRTKVALENFILENYEFSKDAKKIPIKEVIKEWMRVKRSHIHPKFEPLLIRHVKTIFNVETDEIGLTKKEPTNVDDSALIKSVIGDIKYYVHPKHKNVIITENCEAYEKINGEYVKIEIIKYSTGPKIKITSEKSRISARRFFYEAYIGRCLKGMNVFCRNGNKYDLSVDNLFIPKMTGEKMEFKYYKDDVIAVCEYIVAHNKDITNIEIDSNHKYGYTFAKNILDKKSHTEISDKYF